MGSCSNSKPVEVDLGTPVKFNAVMTREDLSEGQHISSYAIEYFDEKTSNWKLFPKLPNQTVSGLGIHGLSVGARMIDFVPETTSSRSDSGVWDRWPSTMLQASEALVCIMASRRLRR